MNSLQALSGEHKRHLLKLARDALELYAKEGKVLQPKDADAVLMQDRGVFVTIEKGGQLRGCIGHIEPVQPLYLDVRDNALNAGFHDPRFRPLSVDELNDVELEISVLTEPQEIGAGSPQEYLDEIEAGVDGIVLEYGGRGATYLPQVWEMLPGKEEFLGSLCSKAGLPGDCWRKPGAKIYRYRVIAFKESEFD